MGGGGGHEGVTRAIVFERGAVAAQEVGQEKRQCQQRTPVYREDAGGEQDAACQCGKRESQRDPPARPFTEAAGNRLDRAGAQQAGQPPGRGGHGAAGTVEGQRQDGGKQGHCQHEHGDRLPPARIGVAIVFLHVAP